MRKTILIMFLLFSTLVITGCTNTKDTEKVLSNKQWIEDINYFDEQMKLNHPDPFIYLDEENWDESIKELKSDVRKLSDVDIALRISQIVSSMKDSHTSIHILNLLAPVGEEQIDRKEIVEFPINLEYFEDGIRVIACGNEYKDILGYKLLAINNTSIEEVIEKVSKIMPYDNSQFAKGLGKEYSNIYEYLRFLEIVDNKEVEYLFENSKQEKVVVKMKAIKNADIDYVDINKKESKISEKVNDSNDFYWYKFFEEDNILYFKLSKILTNQLPSVAHINKKELPNYYDFHNKFIEEINNKKPGKLVVDIRHNPGGSIGLIDFIVHDLKYRIDVEKENIYVITNKNTASAAADLAWRLQNDMGVKVIGEETGGNVNYFGTEGESIALPNSKLKIKHPYMFIENKKGHVGGVKPDVEIIQSFDAYMQGIDDCYEYINNK